MLDPVMLDVEVTLHSIRAYYPDFLRELGWRNTAIARISFYGAMILAMAENPLANVRAQQIVMQRLRMEQSVATARLRAETLKRLMDES